MSGVLIFFDRNSCMLLNSVDPVQTLCSAASDLGLHCLPQSNLWYSRHKRVKTFMQSESIFSSKTGRVCFIF